MRSAPVVALVTLLAASAPAVAHAQEVVAGPPPPIARRFFFGQLRGGPGIPITGTFVDSRAFGGFGAVAIGVQASNGFSVGALLGLHYYANSSAGDLYAQLGLFGRYTFVRELVLHPFLEIGISAMDLTGNSASESNLCGPCRPAGTYVGLDGGGGVEYDLAEHFSLEIAAIVNSIISTGGGKSDAMFEPHLALTYYH